MMIWWAIFCWRKPTGDFDHVSFGTFWHRVLEDVGWMMTNSWKRVGIGRYVGFSRLSKCISWVRSYKREGHECLSIRDGFISGPSMSLYQTWLMHARNNGHKFNSSWVIFWTMSYFMLFETLNDRSLQVKAITNNTRNKSSLFLDGFPWLNSWEPLPPENDQGVQLISWASWLVCPKKPLKKPKLKLWCVFFKEKVSMFYLII